MFCRKNNLEYNISHGTYYKTSLKLLIIRGEQLLVYSNSCQFVLEPFRTKKKLKAFDGYANKAYNILSSNLFHY